jgi:hypothetical protein
MLAGLVMAAEGNTTLRHSRTEIAGGYRELAILLSLVCREKMIRIVVSPANWWSGAHFTGGIAAIWLSSDHFTTSALCKPPTWRSLRFWRTPAG